MSTAETQRNTFPCAYSTANSPLDEITRDIIGAAIEVHKEIGPGLLESAYHQALCFELKARGLRIDDELDLPVRYKHKFLDCKYRIDILVESQIVLELKAVEQILPIHEAQLLTY